MKPIYRVLLLATTLALLLISLLAEGSALTPVIRAGLMLLSALELLRSFLSEYGSDRSPVLHGRATLLSRRVDSWRHGYGSGCFYVATFLLGDTELELLTSEQEYRTLTPGGKGHLVWQSDVFHSFTPDSD